MIAIPRSLARQFRTVLRRCGTHQDQGHDPLVLVRSVPRGLILECVLSQTALRLQHACQQESEGRITFPASTLALMEGRGEDLVTLEDVGSGNGRADWTEAGSTMIRDFRITPAEQQPSFPRPPANLQPMGPGFLQVLSDASQTSAPQGTARSLDRVLLSGSAGQVIGTDGRQLLIQNGFPFPWKEDVLLPRLAVWGSRELSSEEAVSLGMGKEHLFLALGPWKLALRTEPRGRFPSVESVVPSPRGITTRWRLNRDDIALLLKELPRLPVDDDRTAPVEVDIGRHVLLRPREGVAHRSAEVKLPSAEVTGKPVTLVTNRHNLLRALKLGFTEIEITRADVPLCCRDRQRTYVWMPHSEASSRPASSPSPTPVPPFSPSTLTREVSTVPENGSKPSLNGDSNLSATHDPLTEAEAIRGLLTEAQSRLSRLIAALKQLRRQSRALRTAVQSLRELPPLAP